MVSSFLGIGGGPMNLVVLNYFFSMDTKTAAANSLYIILFGQAASLFTTILTNTVPNFHIGIWLVMVAGGICGGMIGRKWNTKMKSQTVESLFFGLLVIIMEISIYNFIRLR